VIVIGSDHDADSAALADAETAVVRLPCVGMLPPPFIDLVVMRHQAEGVLISGCAGHDCFERLGDQWTEQRISDQRDPNLPRACPATASRSPFNPPGGRAART
jgi:coenzyme F420-reducing hydrogenase delta subunit